MTQVPYQGSEICRGIIIRLANRSKPVKPGRVNAAQLTHTSLSTILAVAGPWSRGALAAAFIV